MNRHFLGWERPLISSAADWLWERKDELHTFQVVVPTTESGRKVRQALAEKGACMAPQVCTAGKFGTFGYQGKENLLLEQIVWEEALQGYDWGQAEGVIPKPKGDYWAKGLAEALRVLRVQTGEYGLSFYHVSNKIGDTHPDYERWAILAQWEYNYIKRMEALSWEDSFAVRNADYSLARLPDGINSVIFIGVTDPTEQAARMAKVTAEHEVPVHFLISAPEEHSDGFDEIGRPLTEYWIGQTINWSEEHIFCSAESRAQVELLQQKIRDVSISGQVALGVGDNEEVRLVQSSLNSLGVRVFNPAGKPLKEWSFLEWMRTWLKYCREQKVEDLCVLARSSWTAKLTPEEYSLHDITRAVQEVSTDAKPQVVEDVWHLKESGWPFDAKGSYRELLEGKLRQVLWFISSLKESRDMCRRGLGLDELRVFLALILGGESSAESLQVETAFERLVELAEPIPTEMSKKVDFAQELLSALEKESVGESRDEIHLEALGWLELAFESSPNLLLTGLNEGILPNTTIGDSWLTDSMRAFLGMKTNQDRFGHDVFYLKSLIEARRLNGGVFGYYLKFGRRGDPLKPSRLLLQVPREQLAKRVAHCFSDQAASKPSLPWARDWKLSVPAGGGMDRLSATKIREYLKCPFRFYLKMVLKMQRPEVNSQEWSHREYGSLLHQVLETMKEDEQALTTKNANQLKGWLWRVLDELIERRFKGAVSLAFQIQRESMRQRLAFFSEIEVEERLGAYYGWTTIGWEEEFSFEVDGMKIVGQIDRVDKSPDGRYRLIDYKTGKVESGAQKAHLKNIPKHGLPEHISETAVAFEKAGKEVYWADLQLPLYALAYHQKQGSYPELAYCAIADSAAETKYTSWTFTTEEGEAAFAAVKDIVAQIRNGVFWPPVEKKDRDFDDYRAFGFGYTLSEGMELVSEEKQDSEPLTQPDLLL